MKKQIAVLMLCMCTAVCAVNGCEEKSSSVAVSQETTVSSVIEPTAKLPEGGFTLDDVLNSLSVCGQKIAFPLSLNSLGDDFDFDSNISYFEGESASVKLKYKGVEIAHATLLNCTEEKGADRDTEIGVLTFNENFMTENEIDSPANIGGLKLGISLDELSECVPENNLKKMTDIYEYSDKETGQTILMLAVSENKVTGISVYFSDPAFFVE